MDTCRKCRYFNRLSAELRGRPGMVQDGECRRYPPTVFSADSYDQFPFVYSKDTWCGEFRAAINTDSADTTHIGRSRETKD